MWQWQWMILLVEFVFCYGGNIVSTEYAIFFIPTVSNITLQYRQISDSDIRHHRCACGSEWFYLLVGFVFCYRGNIVSAEYAILSILLCQTLQKNVWQWHQAPAAVDDFNGGVCILLQR